MSFDKRFDDLIADIRAKLAALERSAEELGELVRDLTDTQRPARAPRTPGRIRSLAFVTLVGRRMRVEVDDEPLVMQQTLALTLLAMTRQGGVTRADGREYQLPAALAAEIGRLRGTAPPSERAVAVYVARLRKQLAKVRTDGRHLILGGVTSGWHLALDERARILSP